MHAPPQHEYPIGHRTAQCPPPPELPELLPPELPPPELVDELELEPAPLLPVELAPPELPPLELPLAEPEPPLELPVPEPEPPLVPPLPAPELPLPPVVASTPPSSVEASLRAVNIEPPHEDAAKRTTNESAPKQRRGFIDIPRSNCVVANGDAAANCVVASGDAANRDTTETANLWRPTALSTRQRSSDEA